MQTRLTPSHERYQFDSLAELGEYVDRTPRKWRTRDSRDYAASLGWDLGAGYVTAVTMARNGWIEGAQKAQETLRAFTPATPQPDTRTDFYGFRPHVPRFCAGAPDSMIRYTESNATSGAGRVLTLVVPVNATAGVSAQSMAHFGVAVAQYVNQMETEGTRVELIGAIVSDVRSGERCAHTWTVKHADQPLDLAVVAFSIGHPAMFRRLGFALRERCGFRDNPSYGMSSDCKISDLINPAPGTIILNGMRRANEYAPTAKRALEYVSKQIEAAITAQQEEL